MYIDLYLKKPTNDNPGYEPELLENKDIRRYKITSLEDALELGNIFLDTINSEIGSFLGPYESDYLNYNQCEKLIVWINNNIDNYYDNIRKLFEIILDNCKQAVALKTGIKIDL